MAREPATVASALRPTGIEGIDARILLQHVLGCEHADLIAHSERRLSDAERERFLALFDRRRAGEPIAYLIGWREFYGRRFRVDAAVLIPRPETELLIDLALERLPQAQSAHILDLGTGSGNVGVTLALERPHSRVVAVETDPAAANVARANARTLGASNMVVVEGAWFAPVADLRFDLIVANPPYVADDDPHLSQGDVRFEPQLALRGGSDGLSAIRKIVVEAPRHLHAGGWLLFEHGYDQAHACRDLLQDVGFVEAFNARDLAELPRSSGGRRALDPDPSAALLDPSATRR